MGETHYFSEALASTPSGPGGDGWGGGGAVDYNLLNRNTSFYQPL